MHPRLPNPPRCAVMGVLNVTPDSFSDGGRYLDRDAAIAHGERFGDVRPANTLVQAGLVGDDYLVEIEAEAVVSKDSGR